MILRHSVQLTRRIAILSCVEWLRRAQTWLGDLAAFAHVIASQRVGAKRRPMTGYAKQSISPRKKEWIAHMGNVCVKDEQSPFCSTAATSSSRPRAVQDDARRSSQGRPFRAAAQRLGLELSEHVIMLGPSGTTGTPGVGGSVRASAILAFAIQGSSRFGDLGCLPDP